MKTIGIIGYGSFGLFVANWLSKEFKVLVYDANKKVVPKEMEALLDDVCLCDYVILAVPLSAYETLLLEIAAKLGPKSIVIDVSSVKEKPVEIIRRLMPSRSYIATHPLFGPESASESLDGHSIIFCDSQGVDTDLFKQYCQHKGLKVVEMDAIEHDKQMAVVQGLTFFLARGLNEFGLHKMKLKTPSFIKLLSLAELDKHHSLA